MSDNHDGQLGGNTRNSVMARNGESISLLDNVFITFVAVFSLDRRLAE